MDVETTSCAYWDYVMAIHCQDTTGWKKNYALLIAAYKYEMLFDCLLKVLKNVTIIKNISLYSIDCCENLLKICNAEYP